MTAVWFLLLSATGLSWTADRAPIDFQKINRSAFIYPDYTSITIPPNIAPLNFVVREEGEAFLIKLRGAVQTLTVRSQDGKIGFPMSRWRRFLRTNLGETCLLEIYAKQNGRWVRFAPTEMTIAEAPIDRVLVYRLIDPIYHIWSDISIFQRDLTTFKESLIFNNRMIKSGCINCHAFHQNNPESMMFHVRGGTGTALILATDGECKAVDTRTAFNSSAGAYRCWHPDGRRIAFSVNKVAQFFHACGENRDVYDSQSDLIIYDTVNNTVTGNEKIASAGEMETYPMWTPDGRTLYFCSAPQADFSDALNLPYDRIKYSLKRIAYTPETNEWGEVQTVIDAGALNKSVTHPSVSPDGRFLLFCLSDYGNFSIYRPESDLYLLDLASNHYRRLSINSDKSDSYHSWSSNGRWFVFSSKRENGVTARPYFAYFDETGNVRKPFVMPQKDPEFYLTLLKTYNVPELVKSAVHYSPRQLSRAAHGRIVKAALDPTLSGSAKPPEAEETPWQPPTQ